MEAATQEERDTTLHRQFDEWYRQDSADRTDSKFEYETLTKSAYEVNVPIEEVEKFRNKMLHCGQIQQFGCLLVVDTPSTNVIACAKNTEVFFDKPYTEVLGASLYTLFTSDEAEKLRSVFTLKEAGTVNPLVFHTTENKAVNAVIHIAGNGRMVMDIEPLGESKAEGAWQSHQIVRDTIDKMQYAESTDHLIQLLVSEVYELTQYDRVMVYKFHEDGHGEVVAERKSKRCTESFIGLHYPSTDIPRPSREAFLLTRVRLIEDVNSEPLDIVGLPGVELHDLNLADTTTRAPHPCHCQYLKNMGVHATLVVALVVQDALWGLLVCHQYEEKKFTPFQPRAATEFIAQAFMARYSNLEAMESRLWEDSVMLKYANLFERIVDLPREERMKDIVAHGLNVSSVIPYCSGAAIVTADSVHSVGTVPDESILRRILSIFVKKVKWVEGEIFCTESIAKEMPSLESLATVISGIIAIPLDEEATIVWIRPEFQNVIPYAGNPEEEKSGEGGRLAPRSSFKIWNSLNKLSSRKWTARDKQAAQGLAVLIQDIWQNSCSLTRSSVLVRINAERIKSRSDCVSMAAELTRVIDKANAPIFTLSTRGMVVQWNKKCESLSGYRKSDILGNGMFQYCDPACHQVLENVIRRAAAGEQTANFEVELFCSSAKDETVKLLLNAAARRDDSGVIGVVCIGQDITETRRAMDQCRKVAEDYERLIANGAAPIFGVSSDGLVNEWNTAMQAITGLSKEETRGMELIGDIFPNKLAVVQEDTMVHMEMIISSALNGNETEHFEMTFRNRKDQVVDMLISAGSRRPVDDEKIEGVVFFAQDITERKTLEIANRVRLTAEAASKAKTEQLGFLCHEIRNPLNGLMGNISFLEDTNVDETQRNLLSITLQCCTQLRKIVDDVLDLSKIEEGKLEIESIEFDPNMVLAAVHSQLRLAAQEKGLDLTTNLEQVAGKILVGDPARIMQITSNFAWNAVKFTEEGSVTFEIDIKPAVDRGARYKLVTFSVVDTGPGISAEVQANLFQAYVQADKSTSRHHGGTGLGLSICRQLAHLMDGRVYCESVVGSGTTFFLELEMEVREAAECHPPEVVLKTMPPRVFTNNKTIDVETALEDLGGNRMDENEGDAFAHQSLETPEDEPLRFQSNLTFANLEQGAAASQSESARSAETASCWSFVVVREIIQPDIVMVLGEMSYGGVKRQCWGGASVSECGFRALTEATMQAKNTCLEMFQDILASQENEMGGLTPSHSSGSLAPNPSALNPQTLDLHTTSMLTPQAPQPQASKPKPLESKDGPQYRVLIVDDQAVNCKVATEILKRSGFLCETMDDGIPVVKAICEKKKKYDLVLMDSRMKNMHGEEATRQIREFEESTGSMGFTPIIALSGASDKEDQIAYFKAGMDGIISKPLDTKTLARSVKDSIGFIEKLHSQGPFKLADRASKPLRVRTVGQTTLFDC